ncbi:hypothetical protein, partial [Salmonella sp. NW910]|uniref:hypothetical protein n=1 Tax=unclassified Salmonella TaxID=2614656 RepID=UPI002A42419C|nr:hypothetical protein [Salmonella enterica]
NCDRRWMPNHDRFECQTAIDSDAILQLSRRTAAACLTKKCPEGGFRAKCITSFWDDDCVCALRLYEKIWRKFEEHVYCLSNAEKKSLAGMPG